MVEKQILSFILKDIANKNIRHILRDIIHIYYIYILYVIYIYYKQQRHLEKECVYSLQFFKCCHVKLSPKCNIIFYRFFFFLDKSVVH